MDLVNELLAPRISLIWLLAAVVVSGLLCVWQTKRRQALLLQTADELYQQQLQQLAQQLLAAQERLQQQTSDLGMAQARAERVPVLEQLLKDTQHKLMETQLNLSKSNAMQQTLSARFEAEQQALNDKLALLESSESRLKTQFENLANKIFDDKSTKLQSQNAQQMEGFVAPLKQQLEGFRQQISESYSKEQAERFSLKHQLEELKQLNQRMSEDAVNLTRALKGDNKQQGNWGEVILERVLSESGLRAGHEYDIQQDLQNDSGKHFKPDVIVHLPDEKDVVIDSKMSLLAYERYFNADSDEEKLLAAKEHVNSLRAHIKGLGQKDYQKLHGLKSLDYVLMFIPLEPAFLLALEQEPQLINYALENNIMLVSPTNLLVALRTINNIWRYEYQNQHAQRIARQAGKIYDKLCGFVEDMDKLGRALSSADKCFTGAMGKLTSGRGNLIQQAHQIKQLGAETSKQLDSKLLDKALSSEAESEEKIEHLDAARKAVNES
ncbi:MULTISPECIES: DNA recombination protein RmuC [Shewanella]|jgi:DNA recombination protein RmuC|uniref:DNA recombination protein RmuC n=1 Tax=Shewanella fodinae TaxID=552357 RepID=A0A4R2F5U7_9GAMM|nr:MULTISPECIES: DNA recombination protein RmuC [Shewanella]MBO1270203.1 DNA recombination protein RmuC [Shewanella sp. 4t3-1-2LB]TCN81899.1 DNA recombination protein RmuC [Shewanella fodinae]